MGDDPLGFCSLVMKFNLLFLNYFLTGRERRGRTGLLVTQAFKLVDHAPRVSLVYLLLHRYTVSGLTIGGVK